MIAFEEARELKSPDVFRWRLTSCWVKETFNTAPFFPFAEQSDRSWSSGIVKTRRERKCHRGKRRDNDSRLDDSVRERIDLVTTGPRPPLAFFVKQVEIGVMLMEFGKISANHMLSCTAAAKVGGMVGPSQKY